MLSGPASVFIIAFTTINFLACMWLLWWTARKPAASKAHGKAAATAARTGHVWDGDLEEYNNPLPRWWLGLFIITAIFGAGYLAFYPGLGNFAGTSRWTSLGAYEEQMAEQRELFEAHVARLQGSSLVELQRDATAMSTAKNLFGASCSGCHGSDARGAKGFPNLTDSDWLWGGDEHTVHETIENGRHGVMPAWGPVLGDTGLNEVTSYVVSLSGRTAPHDWIDAGKARFDVLCAACHGIDGKGNATLGAPNLADSTWLHGGDFDSVRATIAAGRDSQMPPHGQLLGDTKVRLLTAYVLSLSPQPEPASPHAGLAAAVDSAAHPHEAPGGATHAAVR